MSVTQNTEYERAHAALSHLNCDDRALWVDICFALKSEFGDTGFDLWDEWTTSSDSYCPKAARATWKSAKGTGGITIATLFYKAREAGWKDDTKYKRLSAEEMAKRRQAAAERQAVAARWPRGHCVGGRLRHGRKRA